MAIIDWPNTAAMRPASVEWVLVLPEAISGSMFNQSTQSVVLGVGYWVATLSIGSRRRTEVQDWEAFIAQFVDTRNRVRLWDHRWETPRGSAGGAPVVSGAGQVGNNILTSGWPATVNGVLMPGDYVGLDGQLRKLVTQANSNGAGQATLALDQPVRASPAAGSAVVVTRPTSIFMCTTDKRQRGFVQDGAKHKGPTLAFQEVFA